MKAKIFFASLIGLMFLGPVQVRALGEFTELRKVTIYGIQLALDKTTVEEKPQYQLRGCIKTRLFKK